MRADTTGRCPEAADLKRGGQNDDLARVPPAPLPASKTVSYRPQTNAERQRLFRQRHPGYDRKYKEQQKRMNAIARAMTRAYFAGRPNRLEVEAAASAPAPPARPARLALPSPETTTLPVVTFVMPPRRREQVAVESRPTTAAADSLWR